MSGPPFRTKRESAAYWLDQQRKWLRECGDTLGGYIAREQRFARERGVEWSHEQTERVTAIYRADVAELDNRQAEYDRLHRRSARRS